MLSVQPIIKVVRTGRIPYATGLQLQNKLANQPPAEVNKFQNYLILQEFNPVYTIGIRTKCYTEEEEERLRNLGAEFYRTNRGGLITFHGPGQLVAYPILHLQQFKPSMRWYVNTLEETVIDACKRLGVLDAKRTEDTGIWVKNNKICAIGVHGSRYITTHGIGLNCCTNLSWFEHIVPCGLEGKGVTTLKKELNRDVSVDEAANEFVKSFEEIFKCCAQEQETEIVEAILKETKLKNIA